MAKIVDIQLGYLADRLKARKIELEFTDAAHRLIMDEGYDPAFSAALVASLLFGGLVVAYSRGLLPIDLEPPSKIEAQGAPPEDVPAEAADAVAGGTDLALRYD